MSHSNPTSYFKRSEINVQGNTINHHEPKKKSMQRLTINTSNIREMEEKLK